MRALYYKIAAALVVLIAVAAIAFGFSDKPQPSANEAAPAPVANAAQGAVAQKPTKKPYKERKKGEKSDSWHKFPWPNPLAKLDENQTAQLRSWVIYQDDDVFIINKPADIAADVDKEGNPSIQSRMGPLQYNNKDVPTLVNRLDMPTTGALLVARNPQAFDNLQIAFADREMHKTYWAVTTCKLPAASGTIDKALFAYRKHGITKVYIAKEGIDGQPSVTHYSVLGSDLKTGLTLVELKPTTGRTHQLRVHMQSIGCSILGDAKYGGTKIFKEMPELASRGIENKLHLHAKNLVIPAMVLGKEIDVTAPLPPHMQKTLELIGLEKK